MIALLSFVALVGCVAANPAYLLTEAYDNGQWHPELDGSSIGSGAFRWGLDDGSWKPHLDGSALGRGDLLWAHRRKRDVFGINPQSLSHPLDEPVNAIAKNAHLIQYNTEATRNILGAGIPLDLPADTPAVAAGKQAHAIAHENQKLATSGLYTPYVSHAVAPIAPIAARVAAPYHSYSIAATPFAFRSNYYGLGYHAFY